MRFSPPPVAPPAELAWLLEAAFGPELPALTVQPARLPELARRFDLGPRIVARHGTAAVEERLAEAAAELIGAHRRAVAFTLAAEQTARRLAGLAARRGLQLVFLKGVALQLAAPGPPGWRPLVDLDVLLPRRQAAELRELVIADGWSPAETPDNPQHLPPVQDPAGTPVDIHFRLRGVQVATERWATAEELLAARLCRPSGLAAGSWLPDPPLLAAHIVAHALEQHGHRPGGYPLLRAVADLADLTAAHGDSLEQEALRLVDDELDEAEPAALFALARILAAGRLPAAEKAAGEAPADRLLRHIVAGVLDSTYQRGLALDHTAGRLRQARRDGELMRYIARKLAGSSDASNAEVGGSAEHRTAASRRILRPIRLVTRFTVAAAARLRRVLDR